MIYADETVWGSSEKYDSSPRCGEEKVWYLMADDRTRVFSLSDNEEGIKEQLTKVYNALKEKGYNPVNQIVGYIVSEDPSYITTHKQARNIIRKIDRDDLLEMLVKSFLDVN